MHHAHIDKFAYQDSAIHRLDSRVKFIVVLVFTAVVISLPRTSLSILACYAIGPFAILVWARIPLKFVFKHILLVSPFVLVLALSCPLYDRTPVTVNFGPVSWQKKPSIWTHNMLGHIRFSPQPICSMYGLEQLVHQSSLSRRP